MEYFYGRVALYEPITKFILGSEATKEFVFYKYADNLQDALELPRAMRVFATELENLARDMSAHLLDHYERIEMASAHAFVSHRGGKARCECGWSGQPTVDKRKSWLGHVRRSS